MGRHTAYGHQHADDDDGVENTIATDGTVEGEITQVGHLGDDDAPKRGVRNTISGGTVSGRVIQAGHISGSLHL
ncbi:hypothetical protein [Nocardiopsis coralliicola]